VVLFRQAREAADAAAADTTESDTITLEEIGIDQNDLAADQRDALEAETEASLVGDEVGLELAEGPKFEDDLAGADNVILSKHIKIKGCREARKRGPVRTAIFRLREHTSGERKDAKFIGHVATAVGSCVQKGQAYKNLQIRVAGLKPGKKYFLVGRVWARNENKPGVPYTLWRWGFSNDFEIVNGKATAIHLPLPIHQALPPPTGGGNVTITK